MYFLVYRFLFLPNVQHLKSLPVEYVNVWLHYDLISAYAFHQLFVLRYCGATA